MKGQGKGSAVHPASGRTGSCALTVNGPSSVKKPPEGSEKGCEKVKERQWKVKERQCRTERVRPRPAVRPEL